MPADTPLKRHVSALIIAGLLFLSAAFLFMKNDRELDPDYRKSWWTLAFAAPADADDSRFIIVNHAGSSSFTYVLGNDDTPIETHIVSVPVRTERIIEPALAAEIRVWPTDHPEDIFSIYRK